MLLKAGLSLRDALSIAQTVLDKPEPKRLIASLSQSVADGSSFSRAIDAMPDLFSPVYRGMVRIGERVGSLETVFERLVYYLKLRHRMREKLISALLYPIVVLVVSIAAMLLLVVVILPTMEESFIPIGGRAGESLELVFSRIRFAGFAFGSVLVVLVALPSLAAFARRATGPLAVAIDMTFLRLPWIGAFAVKARVLQLLFALETLISGGVPLDVALVESGGAVGDQTVRTLAERCAERIRTGMPLSRALDLESVLPNRVARWVQIGERTGNVTAVFAQLRSYYQAETERWSERFMVLIEPALMIFVGAGMILIVVGIVLPLLQAFGGLL